MKTMLCVAVAVMTQFVGLRAQSSSTGGGSGITNGLAWRASARDGLSTTWEATELVTNAATSAVTTVPHRYVEVASGLNYLDPATGQYQPSQDRIELTADGGAVALHGPAKLYVKPNLNTAGAITLVTASNRVFQTRPLGIFWYNAQSGQAVLVAPVQDCVGELVPPNQVVFKSAFGPLADLRLTYNKSGIESDLVLLQQPALPAGWDAGTTRLELWHDWTGAPTPRLTPRLLYAETNATLRSQMNEPDLTDQILDFGDLWFPTGAAYATDGSSAEATNTAREVRVPNLGRDPGLVGVAKTWLGTPGLQVLIEGVRWPNLQPKLQGLPPATLSVPPAALPNRSAWLAQLAPPSSTRQTAAIRLAQDDYRPAGVVLDYYATVPSSWWGYDYSFDSGTTYYVSSGTYFGGGTVTFQPGCIIKFKPSTYLLMYGAIVCNGSSGNPSILTSQDDDLYGYVFSWSSHYPSYAASPAIWDYYIQTNVTLTGMRIRWAHTGIEFDGSGDPYCNGYPDCCGQTNTVTDCTLELCETGVLVKSCVANLTASTRCGVATPTASASTCQWCPTFFGSLTDICPGDSDWDGIPDWWMMGCFGHPTGDWSDYSMSFQDPDCDGVDNLHEYLNGTNPRDWPRITGLADLIVQPGDNATFGFTPVQPNLTWQWFKNGGPLAGGVNPLTLANVQPPDATVTVQFWNYVGTDSQSVRLAVLNANWWDIWSYYKDNITGKNADIWDNNGKWDANGVLHAWNGFTAIGFCEYSNNYPRAGGFVGYPVTALSKYHGITAGHPIGNCDRDYFSQNIAGTLVTFYENDANSTPHTVTIVDGIVHDWLIPNAGCVDDFDYSVVFFDPPLPDSITVSGMRVLTSLPSQMYQPYRPYIGTSEHYNQVTVSYTNLQPVNVCEPWKTGTSGSPEFVPMGSAGGYQLVMYWLCSTAIDWGQVQSDMNTLSDAHGTPRQSLNVQPSW